MPASLLALKLSAFLRVDRACYSMATTGSGLGHNVYMNILFRRHLNCSGFEYLTSSFCWHEIFLSAWFSSSGPQSSDEPLECLVLVRSYSFLISDKSIDMKIVVVKMNGPRARVVLADGPKHIRLKRKRKCLTLFKQNNARNARKLKHTLSFTNILATKMDIVAGVKIAINLKLCDGEKQKAERNFERNKFTNTIKLTITRIVMRNGITAKKVSSFVSVSGASTIIKYWLKGLLVKPLSMEHSRQQPISYVSVEKEQSIGIITKAMIKSIALTSYHFVDCAM